MSADEENLLKVVKEALGEWRRFIIAIDGTTGAGKSTIGRYLSYQLGIPLIETDMHIKMELEPPSYRYNEISNMIETRHKLDRPVLLEGVFALQVLEEVDVQCDYLVYLENSEADSGLRYGEPLRKYEEKYCPKDKANIVFSTDYLNNM